MGGDSNFSLSSVLRKGLFLPSLTNRQGSGLYPSSPISSPVKWSNRKTGASYQALTMCQAQDTLSPHPSSSNPHDTLARLVLILPPVYRGENSGPERLSHLAQGHKQTHRDADIQTQSLLSGL